MAPPVGSFAAVRMPAACAPSVPSAMLAAVCATVMLLLLCAPQRAAAHGWLVEPPSRNHLGFSANWQRAAGNGVGNNYAVPPGTPNVCGDPFQDNPTFNFLARPFSSQRTYSVGGTISVKVAISVNHGGVLRMRLCPRTSGLDQACFNANPLTRADTGSRSYYILQGNWDEKSSTNPRYFDMSWKLPAGVSCAGGCVLQWEYMTYNSCVEPCPASECGEYASRMNYRIPPYPSGPLSYCGNGVRPEVFLNCADITITGGNGGSGSTGGGSTGGGSTGGSSTGGGGGTNGAGTIAMWQKCGGKSTPCGQTGYGPCVDAAWTSPSCVAGSTCKRNSEWWWQCG